VIEAFKDLAEGAFTDAFLDFKSIGDVIVYLADILAFIVVEAAVLGPIRRRQRLSVVFALQDVQIVHRVILENLSLLVVEQVLAEIHDHITGFHWELYLEGTFLVIAEQCLPGDR